MKIQLTQSNKVLSVFSYSSLTDIVLLLLIFFLLTSSFIVSEGIKVQLPKAVNTNTTEQQQIRVSLTNDGGIFINNKKTSPGDVRTALNRLITDPDKQVILLSSDKNVPLERAVFIMDEAKGVGAMRFFISTTRKEKEQ